MAGDEILVVLADGDRDTRALIESRHRITQEASQRLFVIERPGDIDALRATPGVIDVTERQLSAHALADLNDTEKLFASAWAERQTLDTKTRPGEGLPWDAPGYEPPDPPHDRPGITSEP